MKTLFLKKYILNFFLDFGVQLGPPEFPSPSFRDLLTIGWLFSYLLICSIILFLFLY